MVSRRFDGWVSANVGLAAAAGRCVDGAPTLRIPSCAGECPSPLMSANTRLTEPRETQGHGPLPVNKPHRATGRDNTSRLDTASRLHTSRHDRFPAWPQPERRRQWRPIFAAARRLCPILRANAGDRSGTWAGSKLGRKLPMYSRRVVCTFLAGVPPSNPPCRVLGSGR